MSVRCTVYTITCIFSSPRRPEAGHEDAGHPGRDPQAVYCQGQAHCVQAYRGGFSLLNQPVHLA